MTDRDANTAGGAGGRPRPQANWLARSKTTSQWSGALFGIGAAAFVDEVVFHQYVPVGTHHLCIPDAAAVGCRRLSRLLRSKAARTHRACDRRNSERRRALA